MSFFAMNTHTVGGSFDSPPFFSFLIKFLCCSLHVLALLKQLETQGLLGSRLDTYSV